MLVLKIATFQCPIRNNQSPFLDTSQSSLIFLPSSIKACLCSGSIFPFMDLAAGGLVDPASAAWCSFSCWLMKNMKTVEKLPKTKNLQEPALLCSNCTTFAWNHPPSTGPPRLGMFVPFLRQLPGCRWKVGAIWAMEALNQLCRRRGTVSWDVPALLSWSNGGWDTDPDQWFIVSILIILHDHPILNSFGRWCDGGKERRKDAPWLRVPSSSWENDPNNPKHLKPPSNSPETKDFTWFYHQFVGGFLLKCFHHTRYWSSKELLRCSWYTAATSALPPGDKEDTMNQDELTVILKKRRKENCVRDRISWSHKEFSLRFLHILWTCHSALLPVSQNRQPSLAPTPRHIWTCGCPHSSAPTMGHRCMSHSIHEATVDKMVYHRTHMPMPYTYHDWGWFIHV